MKRHVQRRREDVLGAAPAISDNSAWTHIWYGKKKEKRKYVAVPIYRNWVVRHGAQSAIMFVLVYLVSRIIHIVRGFPVSASFVFLLVLTFLTGDYHNFAFALLTSPTAYFPSSLLTLRSRWKFVLPALFSLSPVHSYVPFERGIGRFTSVIAAASSVIDFQALQFVVLIYLYYSSILCLNCFTNRVYLPYSSVENHSRSISL